MSYHRIDAALKTCEAHLNQLASASLDDKEVETYIVSGLVTLIVSEYEEHLESLFSTRAEQCGDKCVASYVKNTLNQKFRSPDLGKINETLKRFDETYRDNFRKEIENSQHHAAWDSIMKARHAVVHKKGQLNMTFGELQNAYALTKVIIENVETALCITS